MKDPQVRGRLIIHFEVKFPNSNSMKRDKLAILESILPPREECIISDDAEEVTLEDYSRHHEQRNYYRSHGHMYDDDMEGGGPGGVQCQTH